METIFKILTTDKSCQRVANLESIISRHGRVDVIDDSVQIDGYTAITGKWPWKTTAWDAAFLNIEKDCYVWFIEDDVAFDHDSFELLMIESANDDSDLISYNIRDFFTDPNWIWRARNDTFRLNETWYSLNSICRLSPTLIKKVTDFREKHNKFLFMEILFASYAESFKDLKADEKFKNYLTDAKIAEKGFYHSVKDELLHTQICEL